MEIRVIGRGALAGFCSGVLAFVFARIFAEPLVDQAIDYEGGRGEILNALRSAAGLPTESEGPEVFSRTIQSTVGVGTGIIAISTAFGALVAVAFLLLHGRVQLRPRALAWSIAAFGFLGLFLLPFAKYPANPPAIGHDFTIGTRGRLYLTMVALSLVLLAAAVLAAYRLAPRFGGVGATVMAAVGFLVVFGVVLAVFPSLGNLQANVDASGSLGFARAATETPQPILNVTGKTLTVDGMTYAPGQLVYPGFDPDLLWRFRWYSIINQLIVWTGIALVFGTLMERLLGRAGDETPAVAEDRAPITAR